MGQNLRKRLEVLERAARKRRQKITGIALRSLSWEEVERLISAHGSAREGRDLTGAELAATQDYSQALIRASLRAGYASIEAFKDVLTISELLMRAFGYAMGCEQLGLATRASQSFRKGRTMSQEEFDAFQNSRALWKRLWRLAGFGTHRDRQMIATRALRSLPWADQEFLLSAHGTERVGRELTEDERAARLAYMEALTDASLKAGYTSIEKFEDVLDIRDLIMRVFGSMTSREERALAGGACKALLEGRTASQAESTALENGNALWKRLRSLAFGEPTTAEPATQASCFIDDEMACGSEAREEPAGEESDHGSEIDAEVVTIGGGSSEWGAGPEKAAAVKENPQQESSLSWESYAWDR